MAELTTDTLEQLKERLGNRRQALRTKLHEERSRISSERLSDTAGEVRDSGDESAAVERTDLESAIIERDAVELREIDGALLRIEEGTYGDCVECGGEIEDARLDVYPTARRCSRCQNVLEKQYANGRGAA
jgi:DnaK suppressor protein